MGILSRNIKAQEQAAFRLPASQIVFHEIVYEDERLELSKPVYADMTSDGQIIELTNTDLAVYGGGKTIEDAMLEFCSEFMNVYDSVMAAGPENHLYGPYKSIVKGPDCPVSKSAIKNRGNV